VVNARRRPTPAGDAATISERLAVLLGAGVSPSTVWGYLVESRGDGAEADDPVAPDHDRLRRIDAAARRGEDVVAAILSTLPQASSPRDAGADAWRAVAAAWAVSTEAGAPVAPALRSFAAVLRGIESMRRDVDVALAGPLVSSRIVLALPVVAVGLGVVLGFDVLGVLFGSPAGLACLAVGAGLAGLGLVWVRRLTARARRADASPGLRAELVAIAMSGGSSASRAVGLVGRTLERVGLEAAAEGGDAIDRTLALSRRAGVPAGELLRAEADSERAAAATDGAARAARLGSLLLVPLGVCVLPAFFVLGVVPMVLSLLSSTGLSW
jgi:tight adherence protein B